MGTFDLHASTSRRIGLFGQLMPLVTEEILHITRQIVEGLAALHKEGICVGILTSDSILLPDGESNGSLIVRITQYAVSHVSKDGLDIHGGLPHSFSIAPEQLVNGSAPVETTFKTDVWALGIVLLEMATGVLLRDVWSLKQYMTILKCSMSRAEKGSLLAPVYKALRSASSNARDLLKVGEKLTEIIEKCLSLLPSHRPTLGEVLSCVREKRATESTYYESVECLSGRIASSACKDWVLREMAVEDAFFLWRLCGSSAEAILVKNNVITLRHPVLTNPSIVVEDLRMFGNDESRKFCVKSGVVTLPDKNVREKLMSVPSMDIFLQSFLATPESINNYDEDLSASRMRLISHLLNSRFYKLPELMSSVAPDIPPMRRADVWCALLDVRSSDEWNFFLYNTLAVHVSDRQLDVDIPRCHQYEELMTSPAAHYGLRRLLKAWLVSHPQYVYWQGCDSLAAPFLLLNFNRLPTALACLTAFIKKYLNNFFLKDNSAIIQGSNEPPPRGLPCSLQHVSYQELKKWHCPRISTEEFAWRVSDQLIVAIDIRPQIEFGRGCVLRSINYPNINDASLLNIAEPLRVAQRNQHPICIVGGKDVEMTRKFSADLVNMGIDGVCVLDGGFEAIRHDTSLIHVPH
ncbi:hypothetical protein ANCCEY_04184 [Ancylostoma ceylanicum]|uniref:non-specific serine/threonine protein kinase n=1 Tax=Ancylostoma ceylanicum TaxID=53326 RepID=A0A0D6LZV0_9BILA|nr:hypothetical protein ANCCEY_04184 [Ancylostoma ceylanicum]